jgi:PleD family two-component response regulator
MQKGSQNQSKIQMEINKLRDQMSAPLVQLENISKAEEFKCLVANDCDFQLMQINLMLKKVNVKVDEAINGLEALETVTQSKEKFDFIILDLNMPIMDGYDACK